jgi:hypothetical protein
LFRYDHEKALRAIARCRALGGTRFRVSPDLAWMLIGEVGPVQQFGWTWTGDPSLPDDTIFDERFDPTPAG